MVLFILFGWNAKRRGSWRSRLDVIEAVVLNDPMRLQEAVRGSTYS